MAQPRKLKCDIRASFAIAFKNWRRENNLPLKQIAADLGLSINAINLWETGKRFPTGHHLELLSDTRACRPVAFSASWRTDACRQNACWRCRKSPEPSLLFAFQL